jgi:hypothetical protein
MISTSPIESFAAFLFAFVAGFTTCVVLQLYVETIRVEAVGLRRS